MVSGAWLAACSAFSESPTAVPADAGAEAAAPVPDEPVPDAATPPPPAPELDGGGAVARCEGALKDDFERNPADPQGGWSGIYRSGTTLEIVSGEGANGSKGLMAALPGGSPSQAFLRRTFDGTQGRWAFCFAFGVKASAMPAAVVLGPRILAWSGDSVASHQAVRFTMAPDGRMGLTQDSFGSCPGTCLTAETELGTFKVGQLLSVVVEGVAEAGRMAPPYGELSVSIDGAPAKRVELTVSLADQSQRELRLGMFSGGAASASFDDVAVSP